MAKSVLLVEDDRAISQVIMAALEAEGCNVDHCTSIARRNALLANKRYAAILTDVMLEDGDGIASLGSVIEGHPDTPVIVLSAQNTLDTAVRASEAGAYEYFPKPFDLDELIRAVLQAIARSSDSTGNADSDPADSGLPLVGRSAPMQNVYRMITRVLRNDLSVLILGESGTGKELVAEAIHQLGHRKQGPFVAVNMAAIPAELIESELFGHEKGAFTGAVAQTIGKFEQAHGGTLFLDEIGDMPMQAQTRLLRTLQTGRITRVGGHREIELDVRFVAATNKPFGPLIEAGLFREDLYYRINVVPIDLPPLRDRLSDIPALVDHFLALAVQEGLPRRSFDPTAIAAMQRRNWRGNVRELRNLVFRAVIMSRDDLITSDALGGIFDEPALGQGETRREESDFEQAVSRFLLTERPEPGAVYDKALAAFETPLLQAIMRQCDGNQVRAAAMLGINRNTLRKKLLEHGLASAELR
ncbi:sigma-54-dependent transcriptional regulator [Sphingomonas sp. 35-24ZXX]|uniref:sigma-54-dependent transcriptional regulator n=1 Tax=Sphingomonas sp. 35-24ZXX TaxID=1545915 RepID=UPI00053BF5C4|nr:sigma-54 dependent transcriptional regulator [Sphingomonas sp. 35-24ZXX]